MIYSPSFICQCPPIKASKGWIPRSLQFRVLVVNRTRAGGEGMRRRVMADEKCKTEQDVAGQEQGRRPWLRGKDIPADFNGAEHEKPVVRGEMTETGVRNETRETSKR